MPPIGERPSLIAATFQPEVGEFRCTTTTFAGRRLPSAAGARASAAAIGIPTMPGPITAIFCTFQSKASGFRSDSGIRTSAALKRGNR
jgi:hypothetical protein